jgi:putative hydroxymethylpyrimidine transport system substrate-binding protein
MISVLRGAQKGRRVATTLAATALLTGCGGGSETETAPPPGQKLPHFDVTLDGYPNPENVALVVADVEGYFEEAGVDVLVHNPVNPLRPIGYALNGSADLSISHAPEVVLAQERGEPVVAIGSVVPEATAAMIWLKKSGIESVADLKGKTIAIEGLEYQEDLLQSVLQQAGLAPDDVEVEAVGFELIPVLEEGRADAIFGGSWNVEGVELEERELEPVVTKVQDLGLPEYEELVLIASRSRLARDPESIRDLISAIVHGAETASDDPELAAQLISTRNTAVSLEETEAALDATLSLISTSGEMDSEATDGLVDWMHGERLIQGEPPASDLLSNDYLPDS